MLARTNQSDVPKSHWQIVKRIRREGEKLQTLDDDSLRSRAAELRERFGVSTVDDSDLVQAFSLVRESARRCLGMPHFDVQLAAALALCRGCIAEMATGEGKTLVTTLPAAVHGFSGRGVHVMTVNAYLAERDFTLMRPVYERLGLTVGHLAAGDDNAAKRRAYAADITYGVGSEFGFDYLRDQLALINRPATPAGDSLRRRLRAQGDKLPDTVQRGFSAAIVDEADSVMIDEAGSALILSSSSGRPSRHPEVYRQAARTVKKLELDRDILIDRRRRTIMFTKAGVEHVFAESGRALPPGLVRPWLQYIEQAAKARYLFTRDVEYVLQDDRVQIVDEFTGRRFEDRRWSNGLHQAVEALEGVPITEENQAMVKISRQRFFGLYESLCGMTGTAWDCANEFGEFFKRPVMRIPLNRRSRRRILKPRFFADPDSKRRAIVDEIRHLHGRGQPVLVGTRTVLESEILGILLTEANIPHRVLNAVQDREEADIISTAGQRGSVTIATNMAGRGSDIPLGEGVARLGGLFVIGSEMHESGRVDRQLLGRAARQGDCGAGRFYVSADDSLITDHAPNLGERMQRAVRADGSLRRNYQREIETLQRSVEAQRFDQRRKLVERDRWLEKILEHAS